MYYSQSLIFRIFDSAYRHKRVFWASFITVVLVVVAYGVTRAQKYSAAITIVLASQSTRNPFNPSDVSGSVSLPDHLQSMVTQFQALTSTKEFIEDALTGYDQKPIPLNSPIDVNNNRQLGDFQKSISISSDGLQSMYVQVTYKNPSDTTALVYGVTSAYLNRYKQEQTSYYSSQVDFLTGEIKAYRQRLADSEKKLAVWKKTHPNGTLTGIEANQADLSDLQDRENDDQVQAASAQQRLDALISQSLSIPKEVGLTEAPAVGSLQAKLDALKAELAEDMNVKNMTADHPIVVALNKQIHSLESSLPKKSGIESRGKINPAYTLAQSRILEARIDVEDQKASLSNVAKRIAALQNVVNTQPGYESDLSDLSRDVINNSQSYNSLIENLEQAKMNLTISKRDVDNEFQMYLTMQPTQMRSRRQIALLYAGGLLVALAMGAVMVFIAEWMDRSIRDPYVASLSLSVPLLVYTPEFSTPANKGNRIVNAIVEEEDGRGNDASG